MEVFYIVINNKQEGPFPIKDIEKMDLDPNTLVWNENYNDWIEIKDVKHFLHKFKKSPPAIPNIKTEDKQIKVIITKDQKIKRKIKYEEIFGILFKLSTISFGIAILTFLISAFGVYNISKFDNHDYKRVTMTRNGGYNFPIDKYSPPLIMASECENDGEFVCLKKNVIKRRENISGLSLTNSFISFIISYLIIIIIFFFSKFTK